MKTRAKLDKKNLRTKVDRDLRSIGSARLFALSETVRERVESLAEYKRAKIVATYVARSNEVQTEQIIQDTLAENKRVLVPKIITERDIVFSEIRQLSDLQVGAYGIMEPREYLQHIVPLKEAQIILVPLVAWDEQGYRIGHGKGYYDIALSGLVSSFTVGLGLEVQKVIRIPVETHDIRLGAIVTEKRTLRFEPLNKSLSN